MLTDFVLGLLFVLIVILVVTPFFYLKWGTLLGVGEKQKHFLLPKQPNAVIKKVQQTQHRQIHNIKIKNNG